MRMSDFLITEKEVSRGLWRLPLIQPIDEEDLKELRSRYIEWRLRSCGYYQATPHLWIARGGDFEAADEVYFSGCGAIYGNNLRLSTLDEFDKWLEP